MKLAALYLSAILLPVVVFKEKIEFAIAIEASCDSAENLKRSALAE